MLPARPSTPSAASGDPAAGAVHAPPPPEGLLRALRSAAEAEPPKVAELREAACAYTRACREAGLPSERVVVAVKAAAAAAGLGHHGLGARNPRLERVVRWCIEEYYRET